MANRYASLDERLWDRLMPATDSYCVVWTGASIQGYGVIKYEGKQWRVHRLVYTLLVGPIPDGMEIDHLCNNTLCAEPDHLEVVTGPENRERAKHRRGGLCFRGHQKVDRLGKKSGQWCPECQRKANR